MKRFIAFLLAMWPALALADATVPSLAPATSLFGASTYLAQTGAANNQLGFLTSTFCLNSGALTICPSAISGSMLGPGAALSNIGAGSISSSYLAPTGVTPGSYTNLNATIGADGRITGASNGSGGGGGGTPGGSNGQVQYNNSGAFGGFTFSGGVTVNPSTGVAVLGNPGPSTLGGIESVAQVGGEFVQYIDTSGVPHLATPSGGGNVTGPGSSVNNDLACFNGTSGTLLADCGILSTNVVTPTSTNTLTNKSISATEVNSGNLAAAQMSANLSAAIDAAVGSTQGDIAYRNATVWTVLPPGTTGQFLETQGASANPLWGTPSGSGNMTGSGAATTNDLIQANNTGTPLNSATDTGIPTSSVVTLTGTQTLTNKTLTSPTINGGTMGAATPWTITSGTPTVYVGLDASSHMVTGTPAGGGNVTGSGAATTGDVVCGNNTGTPLNTAVDCGFAPSAVDDPTTTGIFTVAQWNNGDELVVTTASQTLTAPASSTLSRNGNVFIHSIAASTLAANAADTITYWNGSAVTTTGTGGSISLGAGALVQVTSKVSGNLKVAGNITGGGSGITQLTGDGTAGPGSGSQALTLATVNSNIGTFASETVNGKGLVTAASALSGDLTTSGAVATFATVNSNVGSFTNANITVNAKGLITAAANGSGTPIIFTGTLAGTSTAYTMASPSPTGFALTDQNIVRAKINVTNGASATLAVNGLTAEPIDVQVGGGALAAIGAGTLVATYEYDFVYQTACTCYVVTTTPATGVVQATTSLLASPSIAQWGIGNTFNLNAASLTSTIPVSTTLSNQSGVVINAINAGTITATSPDTITSAAGTTGAGGSVTLTAGTISIVTTDGAGHLYVAGNSGAGSGTVSSGVTPNPAYYASSGTTVSGYTHVTYATGLTGINYNAAALPTAQTGTSLQIGNADATATRIEADAFGAQAFFSGVCYGGTNASPTAITAGTQCGGYNSWLYNGTAVVGPLASFRTFANELQASAGTHGGTYVDITATPNGAQTAVSQVQIVPSAGGSGGGGGAGVNFNLGTSHTPFALTDGATIAVDASKSSVFSVTIAGNRTLGFPTNLPTTNQQTMVFEVTQDGTGARTLAFGSGYTGTIVLNAGAGTETTFTCISTSATTAQCQGGVAAVNVTATNCSSGASPAVCGSARAGSVAIPAGAASTLVVNSTAVTATSEILLTPDESATISATTCNTTAATLLAPIVTARTPGTSFTIQEPATTITNPACVNYLILN